jgi:Skp family chaperone for outer membrane proteins
MKTFRCTPLILLLSTLTLVGCQDSEQQMRDALAVLQEAPRGNEVALDAAYEEARTQALLIKDKDLRSSLYGELEHLYRQRKEPFDAARRQAAAERQRQEELAHQQRLAQLAEQRRRNHQAAAASKVAEGIKGLKWSTRWSLLDDGTKVLILHNEKNYSVDFPLKCYTRNGSSKTLFISVPAYSRKEVGFLEGWNGNFVSGEKCEAYHEGNRLWTIRIS